MDRRWRLEEIGEETNGLEIEVVFGLGLAYKCVLKFKFYLGQKNGVGSITTHFVGFVSFFSLFIYLFFAWTWVAQSNLMDSTKKKKVTY